MNAPSFLAASLYVAVGGAVGAWLRYLTALAWSRAIGPVAAAAYPWATLSINAVGSLLMGVLTGWLLRHGHQGEGWRLLLGVGVLGGFTTFSAFSLDLVQMIERGQLGAALLYSAASLVLGVAALFAGLALVPVAA